MNQLHDETLLQDGQLTESIENQTYEVSMSIVCMLSVPRSVLYIVTKWINDHQSFSTSLLVLVLQHSSFLVPNAAKLTLPSNSALNTKWL